MNERVSPPAGAELLSLLEQQRAAYLAAPQPSADQRRDALRRLKRALLAHRGELAEAAARDFGRRSRYETLFADIMPSVNALNDAIARVGRWMRPQRRRVAPTFQPASARVVYQPLGVVGIIVPWNYPVFLAMGPLAGALAAGNRVMLKLSEFTPETNAVLRRLIEGAFEPAEIAVVLGDRDVGEAFSRLPFDHLLFTGSTAVGHHVMRAAAEHLTPVTLELGGKSPAIVGPGADLALAAGRIALGKALNAGQTCVAPDYVLCPRERLEAFVEELGRQFRRMYPDPHHGGDYSAIINERHFQRLLGLRDEAAAAGARIVDFAPPPRAPGTRILPLTVLLDVAPELSVMREEIFGPLLPVLPYDRLDEALDFVRARPRPLALYYFDHDPGREQRVIRETHSGGVCINDTLIHLAQDDLPFGGIGASGMGHYHGHEGFLTFSKVKPVLRRRRLNPLRPVYPPFKPRLLAWVERLLLR